jgi:hypothetical protein
MIKLRKVASSDGSRPYVEVIYGVGDEVWISPSLGLFIKCKIVEIDDEARQRNTGAYLFYDVDEPIGHDLGSDDLYPSLDAAVSSNLDSLNTYLGINLKFPGTTLEEWRAGKIAFIRGTHGEDVAPLEEWATYYSNKVRGVDWVNIMDLMGKD